MAWNLSTGATHALLGKTPSILAAVIDSGTISFGDGDGTGLTDTINDSASGLATFSVDDFILICNPNGINNNLLVKALTVAAGKIEVEAGSFSAEAASTDIALLSIASGSIQEVFKNSTMDIYSGSRPTGADSIESGTKLLAVTKDAGSFTAGISTNGLNMGEFDGNTLKRAIDPSTEVTEIWKGIGLVAGTAGYVRWYANAKTTGASTSAIRMDGTVAISGADVNIVTGTSIVVGVYTEVTDVSTTLTTA